MTELEQQWEALPPHWCSCSPPASSFHRLENKISPTPPHSSKFSLGDLSPEKPHLRTQLSKCTSGLPHSTQHPTSYLSLCLFCHPHFGGILEDREHVLLAFFCMSSAKASAKNNQAIHSVCGPELSPSLTCIGKLSTATEELGDQGSAASITHTGEVTVCAGGTCLSPCSRVSSQLKHTFTGGSSCSPPPPDISVCCTCCCNL